MKLPLISIGMPVRNGVRFIARALDSILAQEYENFEIVISDNASDDGTNEICRKYTNGDSRIRYYCSDTNRGAAWNYNQVFKLSRGKYFKWAAHDDECLPQYLLRCLEILENAPEHVVLVYPRSVFIDPEGQVLGPDVDNLDIKHAQAPLRFAQALYRVNLMSAIFGLFRAEALSKTRLIDRFIASDYVFMGEIALLGQIWELPEVLFRRRQRCGSCMEANTTNKAIRGWFDPKLRSQGNRIDSWFPGSTMHAKLIMEWARSVTRLPLRTTDKLLCYPLIPAVWYSRMLHNWAGLQKSKLKRHLGMSPVA